MLVCSHGDRNGCSALPRPTWRPESRLDSAPATSATGSPLMAKHEGGVCAPGPNSRERAPGGSDGDVTARIRDAATIRTAQHLILMHRRDFTGACPWLGIAGPAIGGTTNLPVGLPRLHRSTLRTRSSKQSIVLTITKFPA